MDEKVFHGFNLVQDNNTVTMAELLLMDGTLKLVTNFDKESREPVHTASLYSKGKYNYGISISIRPKDAEMPIDTPYDLQRFTARWLQWYAGENEQHDREHAGYWNLVLNHVTKVLVDTANTKKEG